MDNKNFLSIHYKLALFVGSFFIVFILIFLILSQLFLDDFYISRVEEDMYLFTEVARTSEALMEAELLTDLKAAQDSIGKLRDTSDYHVEILDNDYNVILSTIPESRGGSQNKPPQELHEFLAKEGGFAVDDAPKSTVINDPHVHGHVIISVSRLTDGHLIVFTQHMGEVLGNASVANHFFLLIGILLSCIWAVSTYFIAKAMTKRITRISGQAKEIAAFNFTSHYDGHESDEIGQLGQYMNQISKELEAHITDLNFMNLKLQDDMVLQRRFFSSITHELKSPIGIIKGYAESIKLNYYETVEERDEFADNIVESADQLSALVEDIILLSMLDRKTFKLTKSDLCLSELLEKVCQRKAKLYECSAVRFATHIQPDIMIKGDEMRLVQVIDNLLENGFRYTAAPWKFEVTLQESEVGLWLHFINSSAEIKDKDLTQIFSPFYRFESSHSKKTGGHGLGLSIVKALVEASGGEIDVAYADHEFRLSVFMEKAREL